MVGAYFGAQALHALGMLNTRLYFLGNELDALKTTLGFLILFFALFEVLPSLKELKFGEKWIVPGGILSGFFGGLSGHQGALRSAFLIKTFLKKESFVATGAAIALLVDAIRISTYYFSGSIHATILTSNKEMLIIALTAAFAGAIAGKQLLKKIKLPFIQKIVAVFMSVIAVLLIFNLI